MGNYRASSQWSDTNELRCLQALLMLQEHNFPRGMQADLSREIVATTELTYETVNAKIGNYKSLLGLTAPSSASSSCKKMYKLFGHLMPGDLTPIIEGLDDEQL
ncbi:MAG: hypothetical protein PSN46_07240 [Gammaproteobacteria bacterium]|nr:hypothetical protein [Gammaproteobacteria bacterium]